MAHANAVSSWLPGFEPGAQAELPSTWTEIFDQTATAAPRALESVVPTSIAIELVGREVHALAPHQPNPDDLPQQPAIWRTAQGTASNEAAPKPQHQPWPALTREVLTDLRGSVTKFEANIAAIEALQRIEVQDRIPSDSERRSLLRFTGWGGLPKAFNFEGGDFQWVARAHELKDKLAPKDYGSAKASVNNSHYTDVHVVEAIWRAAHRLGFRGGRVLEPAAGVGHFLGAMPPALAEQCTVTAVELDSIAGRILKRLYASHGVSIQVAPFEQVEFPENWFDLVIGNVPFGNYPVVDTSHKPYAKFSIHNYFLGRALDLLKPGGLLCMITSSSTLDSESEHVRAYLASQCELLGAIRLPSGTFSALASTDAQADVLFMRKLQPGRRREGDWLPITSVTDALRHPECNLSYLTINAWYANHPEFVIGRIRPKSNGHERVPTAVFDGELEPALIERVDLLPEQAPRAILSLERTAQPKSVVLAEPGSKPGSHRVVQGRICRVVGKDRGCDGQSGFELRDIHDDFNATQRLRIAGMCDLRDTARALLDAQLMEISDSELEVLRQRINVRYDRFVTRYGPVSNRGNALAFRRDPDYPLLLSLEHFDPESGIARKAALFTQRTLRRVSAPKSVSDPNEALAASIQWRGRVDQDYMAKLLEAPEPEVLEYLSGNGQIFLDPADESWKAADDYLSGNVREKLKQAKAAGERFQRNVDALCTVQPEDLPAGSIEPRLGAVWIPASDIEAFMKEVLEQSDCTVSYSAYAGTWAVKCRQVSARASVKVTQEFGTARVNAVELVQAALNLQVPTVRDPIPGGQDRYRVNPTETLVAREKQALLKERFAIWAFEDTGRRERLCRVYNDLFNSTRPRRFDGSHLKLPGFSHCFALHTHQLDSIWRVVQKGNVGLFHVVGAGKTAVCVIASMEMRRLGFLSKPCHVVPNHMLEQYTAEFVRLYPQASVLMASKDDMDGERRRELVSRIATGDWDAVVITHSSFERIRMSQTFTRRYVLEILDEIEMGIRLAKNGDKSNRIIKQLERMKKVWNVRLTRLAAEHKKDDLLTWEQLGIDGLFVDEAHLFKNLFRFSKMTRVAGLPQSNSERAFDLYLKTQYTMQLHAPALRGVVLSTATPIANTMAEVYTMQRYLQPQRLVELGLQQFDSWAATFGESVTALEIAPDGSGYRMHTRFARFVNVPELMALFGEVADIRTAEMLALPVPRLLGDKARTVSCPASSELRDYIQTLVERAQAIRSGRVTPEQDNMLAVTNDGRAAALDFRLVARGARFDPTGKVAACTREVMAIWHRTAESLATQLVFCDLSSPKGGRAFSVYTDLKQRLIEAGMPPQQIAFIHDAETDAQKAVLFQAVREGRVRVLIGSTSKLGIGTNVQKRLVALHHLDAPWRPCDVEQRDGRILRQGNDNDVVEILRYVTERSFDAYMWQTLETKVRFIAQVMKGDQGIRSLEDVELAALSYAEIKALASGNPLVIEKAGVDAEIAKLSALFSVWRSQRWRNQSEVSNLPMMVEALEKRCELLGMDCTRAQEENASELSIELSSRRFSGDEAVGGALRELLKELCEDIREGRTKSKQFERIVGRAAGFSLGVCTTRDQNWPTLYLSGHCRYPVDRYQTGPALADALRRAVASVQEEHASACDRLKYYRKRLEDLNLELDRPFECEKRLTELQVRQRELLNILDLDKDEAGSVSADSEAELLAA